MLTAGSAGFLVLDRLYPPDFTRLATVGTEVLDREGRTLGMVSASGGIWRLRTTVDDVSPVFLDLLLRTEDRRFYQHGGVDLLALARAVTQWAVAGRIVSGGSTLTMQAARLLEPRRRTLVSKVIEAFRAVQLEERLDKRQILGIWLTLAPYGGNLEGVRAGAQAWFGKRPATLDPAQAALLVAIPRRPEALRPDRHANRATLLRNRLLGSDADAFGSEPVPAARIDFPRHAEAALRPALAAAVSEPIRTTLDLSLQLALEQVVTSQLRVMQSRASLSVMVVNADSRDVKAVVSGDGSKTRGGALDLTRAWRSPGSALKPLLYGLAFQDGLVSPSTPMNDLPRHFGPYAPEDFDRSFAGEVTAAEALQRSLNLPAVALLDRIGPHRFHAWLMAAGIGLRLPAGAAASLPLALGGVGIQLRDLARIYAALGTDGTSRPLRWMPGGAADVPRPLLQPSAAGMVANVLTRPFPGGGLSGIAWKTGTSWGGRDAWAAGFDGQNVVVVWAGRPDGTAIPGATGVRTALPVLHGVFGLLPSAPRTDYQSAKTMAVAPMAETGAIKLLFPPPGATLSADGPVPIRVMGGRRPITFLVDGIAVPSVSASRTVLWQPGGPGFYAVAAEDADGSVVKIQVRVR